WVESLAEFVRSYPRAGDTPEALLQLGMVSEFLGDERAARRWYERLSRDFPDTPAGAKARGARARLDGEGKRLHLAGPRLADGAPFGGAGCGGTLVVVYYWASWSASRADDFARLRRLRDRYRGLDVVGVNLDDTAEEARAFVWHTPAPGVQLHQDGSLDSPLA